MSYIDARGKVFAHLDRLAAWQAGKTPAPVTVEWDLSNVCSLGCQSCHFAHTHVAGPWAGLGPAKPAHYTDTGRFADVALVERGLAEMAALGVRGIVWSGGGEPTLHPAFADIVELAHSFGLEQGLYTLGGHITESLALTLGPCLSWVVVSLDAETPDAYAAEKRVPASRFDAACAGVRLLASTVPVVGVSFLLHGGNYTRTDAMLALSRSLGATYTTFRPTVEFNVTRPSVPTGDVAWLRDTNGLFLTRLAEQPDVEIDVRRFAEYRDWSGHGYQTCHGCAVVTMVTPDGRVWVCPNKRGLDGAELGDLREESFASLWSRHRGQVAVDDQCRVMCRFHLMNTTLAQVHAPRQHEAFV